MNDRDELRTTLQGVVQRFERNAAISYDNDAFVLDMGMWTVMELIVVKHEAEGMRSSCKRKHSYTMALNAL